MALRKIIEIDEDQCNGCGQCIPNCPEGALQIIDGKARLVSDLFCDGLGACIGECPVGAISVIEREAEPYNETKVMENIARQGRNVINAHLKHLKDHNETALYNEALKYLKDKEIEISSGDANAGLNMQDRNENDRLPCGCPGSAVVDLRQQSKTQVESPNANGYAGTMSELKQWPVQLKLVPPNAPYFQDSELLIAADCAPFAYAGFHEDFIKDKVVLIGCPKLDDSQYYIEKLTEIFKLNDIKTITVAHMEVPCCFGLAGIVAQALENSGREVPVRTVNISIKGKIL